LTLPQVIAYLVVLLPDEKPTETAAEFPSESTAIEKVIE
jgi:hypothetical protein